MTSERPSTATEVESSRKEKDAALAVVDTAFRTAADDLRSKREGVAKLLQRGEVLMEKYQVIAAKAQRYKAWHDAIKGGRE